MKVSWSRNKAHIINIVNTYKKNQNFSFRNAVEIANENSPKLGRH